jgi:ribonuclease R
MKTGRERHFFNLLPDVADLSSQMERQAVEAERESAKVAHLFMMKDKLGEEFEGKITGVQHYGCFVEVNNGAEGLLHVRELPGYYTYDEEHFALRSQSGGGIQKGGRSVKQRASYQIGDKVMVKLIKVNEMKRTLDFGLAEPA